MSEMEEASSSGRPAPPATMALSPENVLFNKYEMGKLLGCGGFAKVYHARDVSTGQSVAIKVISKSRLHNNASLMANIKREISVMRRLRHPYVVKLYEVMATKGKIYFVMEFVKGGELFAKVAKGRFSEDLGRKCFQQLISAVSYCHSHGVFHRDLKPENLLLDENGDLKVSDFGLSASVDQFRADGLLHTICGSPAYVAPEILAKKGYDGAKVDVWSCGVVLFVLTAGYLPFNDPNLMNMYRKIYKGEFRCPRWMSPDLKRFLSRILDTNPETRITIEEIKQELLRVRNRQRSELRRQQEEEMALLYADPFDVEAQKKIEAAIRQKGIDENWAAALEYNPEAFARVVMLYVDMEVNGIPLKAFVDSGAQSTIISKSCAERCGLLRLLDTRYKGIAHGVGQSEILGRIHVAPIKIGSIFYPCSFLVLDAPNMEFLFGLDMLRKHQCIIDLKENVLRVGGGEVAVPFLAEKDIPSRFLDEERYAKEASSSGAQASSATKENIGTPGGPSGSTSKNALQGPEFEAKVAKLVELGFGREQVIQALKLFDGNEEQAAGFLFGG